MCNHEWKVLHYHRDSHTKTDWHTEQCTLCPERRIVAFIKHQRLVYIQPGLFDDEEKAVHELDAGHIVDSGMC